MLFRRVFCQGSKLCSETVIVFASNLFNTGSLRKLPVISQASRVQDNVS